MSHPCVTVTPVGQVSCLTGTRGVGGGRQRSQGLEKSLCSSKQNQRKAGRGGRSSNHCPSPSALQLCSSEEDTEGESLQRDVQPPCRLQPRRLSLCGMAEPLPPPHGPALRAPPSRTLCTQTETLLPHSSSPAPARLCPRLSLHLLPSHLGRVLPQTPIFSPVS